MNITIVTVGKLKEKYLKMGIEEFSKRLGAYAKIDLIEVADEKAPETLSQIDMDIVKRKEGERILAKINDGTYVIALALDGKMKTSEEMAADLDSLMTYGKSKIAFAINITINLDDRVRIFHACPTYDGDGVSFNDWFCSITAVNFLACSG